MIYILILIFLIWITQSPSRATTIAVDSTSMAADSQITCGDYYKLKDHNKACRINGYVVGCCGNVVDIKKFKSWFAHPSPFTKPKLSNMSALVVTGVGVYEFDESCLGHKVEIPYAIGSGASVALGAMKAGATAEEAVGIACEIDLHSSGPVHVIFYRK